MELFLAGSLGAAINSVFELRGISAAVALVVGVALVVVGVFSLWRGRRQVTSESVVVQLGKRTDPSLLSWVARQVLNLPPAFRSAVLGFGAILLPCGWLYSFVALAGATGSGLQGAATMFFFWLGTVPALWLAATVLAPFFQRLRSSVPHLAAWIMIFAGGMAIFFHFSHDHGHHDGMHHHGSHSLRRVDGSEYG